MRTTPNIKSLKQQAIDCAESGDPADAKRFEQATGINPNVFRARLHTEGSEQLALAVRAHQGKMERLKQAGAKTPLDATVEDLSNAFSQNIADQLSPAQLGVVRRTNTANPTQDCATHQFCDANDAMQRAWDVAIGTAFNPDNHRDSQLRRDAWQASRDRKFAAGGVLENAKNALSQNMDAKYSTSISWNFAAPLQFSHDERQSVMEAVCGAIDVMRSENAGVSYQDSYELDHYEYQVVISSNDPSDLQPALNVVLDALADFQGMDISTMSQLQMTQARTATQTASSPAPGL